jgi:Tfp pilus assembly protein PilO
MLRSIPIISVIGVFILFVAILGGYYFWLPEYGDFQTLKLKLEAERKRIAYAEEHFSKLQDISRKLEEYKDEIKKIDSALPVEFSISALFNFIQGNCSKNGLILEEISLDKSSLSGLGKITPGENSASSEASQTGAQLDVRQEGDDIEDIPFSISVFGTYSGFKDFITDIYKNARIIEVDSIEFSSDFSEEGIEAGSREDLFVFDLRLKTHHYRQ